MVYCDNCGAENPDNMKFCGHCGKELYKPEPEAPPAKRSRLERKPEDECFGVPGGGMCCWIVVGIMMITSAIGTIMGWDITEFWANYFGPVVFILIGSLIIVGAILDYRRRH